jgi:hypothetical protein
VLSAHADLRFALTVAFQGRSRTHDGVGVSRQARKLLSGFPWEWIGSYRGFQYLAVRFGRFTMSIFAYRKHLRFLTHSQRRRWWDQKKRLTPRVKISGAYVPPNVTREFTYVKVG